MKTFSKGSFTRFFQKMAPGGGGGVLPDSTRRGTNYLHTTLHKTYPKAIFWTPEAFFWIHSPQNRGGPYEKCFQKAHLPVFSKNWPPVGGRFIRFHKTWH